MKRRILVLLAHPSPDSFNAAMADQYATAARTAGADVKVLKLGELEFDPILRTGYKGSQELEPDLEAAKQQIEWAEHLSFSRRCGGVLCQPY
ncbi:MAG: NAD(P)H-dependent oxidoreductase [Kofleriaceae bacterium]|nr:NAD(P)H-dependent oxidoreductase [Kofleriaceae bacterium]